MGKNSPPALPPRLTKSERSRKIIIVALSSNTWARFSIASRYHAAIWVGCSSCLVASSATVSSPLIASSATLALNSAENRLRVLMVGHPSHQRIHLSRLCQEVGPPLSRLYRASHQ